VATEAATRADADAVVNMLTHRGVALAPEASFQAAPAPTYDENGQPIAAVAVAPPLLMKETDGTVLEQGQGQGDASSSSSSSSSSSQGTAKPLYQEITSMRPDNYSMPPSKRVRVEEEEEEENEEEEERRDDGNERSIGKEEAAHLDKQYADAGIVWYPDTDSQYAASSASSGTSSSGTSSWKPATDPSSGSTYYYNEKV
jgi:hypothetical protein